ncbi:Long chain acyl-CoA synthetase 6, peroxisomal [Acorus calamus]|uniref:4-coumarate--CoA ligase n=1 Tax=Acorus calamus TaxID=4465 RepID=A0AAV9ERF0_ACOCL|nr:Long chain acyl-CoA synthetase 6, peroxisomal [Acorus calamus]
MEETAANRRLRAIQDHISASSAAAAGLIEANATAGEFVSAQGLSVVLPEKLQTGKWNVYRSAHSPLKLIDRFPDHPDIGTLHDNFVRAVDTFRDYKYLGTRIRVDGTVGEYKWMTYGEAGTFRTAVGSSLVYYGIPKGSCIGLYFINRPEWIIVDHACSAYSYVSVPLYDTLGPDAVKYIVNHASVQAIFCVHQTLNILLSFLSDMPFVRLIVVVGGTEDIIPSLPSTSGIEIISYSKLIDQGRSNLQKFCPPKPEDIATICYTSGTTGTPKGVVLTHGNLIANVAGSSISVKFYPSDMIMNAVKTSGVLKQRLFNTAYNAKLHAIVNGKNPSPMWDRLVFNKIKAKLGGRVRFMTSGASPLSPDVLDFLRVCFGGVVVEGYGMTETSCVISTMEEGDTLTGHVGPPNPCCEIKLVDVPEMNYTSEDQPYPRGEICVRGPIVFQGYYKDDIQTKEVIDDDGWLHTGDIGDSFNSSLVAVVAVDHDMLKSWAASEGIKIKRPQAKAYFAKMISDMYAELSKSDPAL